MSAHRDAISADLAAARALLDEGHLLCLEFEDDTVTFQVPDVDGEFTAFPADPYPGGETSVYGPDDFEFSSVGTLKDVITGVLKALVKRKPIQPSETAPDLERHTSQAESAASSTDFAQDDDGDEDFSYIVKESPLPKSLRKDVDGVKQVLGDNSVTSMQLSEISWRIRISVPIKGGHIKGLDAQTASAWGLDPAQPLVIELHAQEPSENAGLPADAVQAVFQEGFPSFALEKQMLQILRDFCCVYGGGILPSRCPCGAGNAEDEDEDSEFQVIRNFEAKKQTLIQQALLEKSRGFLACLACYAQIRVPTVHEYCAICDQPFSLPPMFLRTVCSSELCTYQFSEFGEKITTAEGVNTQAEVVDLLICMLARAAESPRRDLILDPYPTVYAGSDKRELVFHPKDKDFDKLNTCVQQLRNLRNETAGKLGASWSVLTSRMSNENAALIKWVVASNRSFLAPLQDNERLEAFKTPFQYLLISAPPEKEQQFQELKAKFGSCFAFHGSPAANWHSILRNGLKNASNTKLMIYGAAHGPGIYISPESSMSLGYANSQGRGYAAASKQSATSAPPPGETELKRQKTGNRFVANADGLVMMAVCEVINDEARLRKPTTHIWVASEPEVVCTRFFLVFTEAQHQTINVRIHDCEKEIRKLVENRAA